MTINGDNSLESRLELSRTFTVEKKAIAPVKPAIRPQGMDTRNLRRLPQAVQKPQQMGRM